jgi:7,8-dihydropterin-6-yl-methyl-4-(beta-D-ribofuranosyl)aminobenzene 5'-phosphate synthase
LNPGILESLNPKDHPNSFGDDPHKEGADMGKNKTLNRLIIQVIAEDSVGYETPYLGQHGISILLTAEHQGDVTRVLVDVAQDPDALLENFKRMNIPVSCVDALVLTHCHYDHTQGVARIIREIGKKNIPVIAHPDLFRQHFTYDPDLRHIGVMKGDQPEDIEAAGGELYLSKDPVTLMPGLTTTGEVPRTTDFEEIGMSLFTVENGNEKPDSMADDLSVVANVNGKGLVIVTGCSHAGIVNISHHAMALAGTEKIHGIIGGFHLIEAPAERIRKTVSALEKMNPDWVCAGHCTGFKAQAELYSALKDRFSPLHTGYRMDIE